MDDLSSAARLLLQHGDLFARGVGSLGVLQQFTHAQDAGERIVEFVSDTADHRAHGSQALALHNLLFKFLLGGDVAHRNDYSARICLPRQRTAAWPGAHGAPASIAVPRAVLRRSENICAGGDIVVKDHQFRRVILGLRDFLSQHFLRFIAQQVADCVLLTNV